MSAAKKGSARAAFRFSAAPSGRAVVISCETPRTAAQYRALGQAVAIFHPLAKLSPDAAGATLSVSGDVAFASGAALAFEIGEDGVPGTGTVSGKVTFAGPAALSVTSAQGRLPDGDYVLLRAGSMPVPADFASWTVSLPAARDASVAIVDGALVMRVRSAGTVVFFR